MNGKDIAHMYGISRNMFFNLVREHKKELNKRATRYRNVNGKLCRKRDYNPMQLRYIVDEIMGYSPEGYSFTGKIFEKEKADKP